LIKGKILNVENARLDKVLSNDEVRTIIAALGTGIGSDFTLEKLRYHKIILMADADVDGSHIRTLLLTLLYRQMPQLIEKGHVYIAQPPLFKIKRGKREEYIETEADMDALLFDLGKEGMKLTVSESEKQLSDSQFNELLEVALELERVGHSISKKGITFLKYLGLCDQKTNKFPLYRILPEGEPERFIFDEKELAEFVKQEEQRRGKDVELKEAGGLPTAEAETATLNVIGFHEANDLIKLAARLGKIGLNINAYDVPLPEEDLLSEEAPAPQTKRKAQKKSANKADQQTALLSILDTETKKEAPVYSLRELLQAIRDYGKQGMTIQRYKGLGEMNPAQLWETTMNPDKRTMLKVAIEDAVEADEMFTVLMGDAVGPRRDFIELHAKDVRNLDV
ncbi:MAG: toprim domain-containing protein, partial [Candidatus Omnitrophica bacterium]|nr:toprim domain-containing protein [Candidatus Omnitrophota bacterium]